MPKETHYQFIERVGPRFEEALSLTPGSITEMAAAHGDKSRQYDEFWAENNIPFKHGALVHLLSYHPTYVDHKGLTRSEWVVAAYFHMPVISVFFGALAEEDTEYDVEEPEPLAVVDDIADSDESDRIVNPDDRTATYSLSPEEFIALTGEEFLNYMDVRGDRKSALSYHRMAVERMLVEGAPSCLSPHALKPDEEERVGKLRLHLAAMWMEHDSIDNIITAIGGHSGSAAMGLMGTPAFEYFWSNELKSLGVDILKEKIKVVGAMGVMILDSADPDTAFVLNRLFRRVQDPTNGSTSRELITGITSLVNLLDLAVGPTSTNIHTYSLVIQGTNETDGDHPRKVLHALSILDDERVRSGGNYAISRSPRENGSGSYQLLLGKQYGLINDYASIKIGPAGYHRCAEVLDRLLGNYDHENNPNVYEDVPIDVRCYHSVQQTFASLVDVEASRLAVETGADISIALVKMDTYSETGLMRDLRIVITSASKPF